MDAPDRLSIPSLPPGSRLTYVDEGAANVVYSIDFAPSTPPVSQVESYGDGTPPPTEVDWDEGHSAIFENKLLRVRKNLPTTAPCQIAQDSWQRRIRPLFDTNEVVNQKLVRLSSDTIKVLNNLLQIWEATGKIEGSETKRLAKRQGTYIADDLYGLLVTDMTPGQYFVEFKPKWLAQSPSAPATSKRCRTCALAARTKAQGKPGEPLKSPICPLDLISSDPDRIDRAARLFPDAVQPGIPRLSRWLQSTGLLKKLRDLQLELDKIGVLRPGPDLISLQVAMTLRDCTIFLRFPDDPKHDDWAIEARIGDLDLKSTRKLEYWKSLEIALIEEGWYEGTEKASLAQPLTCALFRP